MKNNLFDIFFRSVMATIMIGIGCLIYINHSNPFGALFFAIGLLGVFFLRLNLFTGLIGYINKNNWLTILLVLLFNLLAAFIFLCVPIVNFDFAIKLSNPWYFILFKSLICGVLIYLCVNQYKEGRPWVTLIGVPAFILSGAEHCIADMIYLVLTRTFTLEAFGFILLVILGNSVGSLIAAAINRNKVEK